MKRNIFGKGIALMAVPVLLSSCSYGQFAAVSTGGGLGGMIGSSIGGIMGGPRGADKGTLAGVVIGGAIGAVVSSQTAQRDNSRQYDGHNNDRNNDRNGVQYDTYNQQQYRIPAAANSDLAQLEVSNVNFVDSNNNRRLDSGEKAYIVFDIYNRSQKTLYNVAPTIKCSSKRVAISSPATVESVQPGQGIRYTAAVVPVRKLRNEPLTFTVSFGSGQEEVVAKTFSIKTASNAVNYQE